MLLVDEGLSASGEDWREALSLEDDARRLAVQTMYRLDDARFAVEILGFERALEYARIEAASGTRPCTIVWAVKCSTHPKVTAAELRGVGGKP